MLCKVCKAIDFRPLSEWNRPAAEINDESNAAYQWRYIDDDAVMAWRNGDGMLQTFYFHHTSPSALRMSAEGRCYLCATIYFALFADSAKVTHETLTLPTVPSTEQPIVLMLFLQIGSKHWQDALSEEFIRVFCGPFQCRLDSLDAFTKAPIPADQYLTKISRLSAAWEHGKIDTLLSTWSILNQNLATSWYFNCLVNHSACTERIVTWTPLPKRVVDIGPSTCVSQPVLIEPVEGTLGTYITLSYCCGDIQPLSVTTTRAGYEWPLPLLTEWPTVFQDAIVVSKALGIRYLWIDSICIQQGNAEDWEVESGKMAQYYQNSTLTIAAAAAAGSHQDGLFSFRNPLMTYPYCLVLKNRKGRDALYSRYLLPSKVDDSPADRGTRSPENPLYSRAWVLQEELLSPRVLRFGHQRMHWQCHSCFQSESVILDENFCPTVENATSLQILIPEHTPGWIGGRNPHYDAWYQILSQLNARNITYQHDMLPSISGVAQVLHRHLNPGDEYLAGIWRLDFQVGLLWCTLPDDSSRAPVEPSRLNFDRTGLVAPSWSWVSMAQKQICFQLHPKILTPYGTLVQEGMSTELLSHNTTVQNNSSPYGTVLSGSLMFAAQCPSITIFLDREPQTPPDGAVKQLEFRVSHGPIPFKHIEVDVECFPHLGHFSLTGDEVQIIGDCVLDSEPAKLSISERLASFSMWPFEKKRPRVIHACFLPLLHYSSESTCSGLESRTMGLALAPVRTNDGPIQYKRIGRAALNIRMYRWRSCSLPLQEVQIV